MMENVKEEFRNYFRESLKDNNFVKLTFGKYRGGDSEFEKILVSRIETKEGNKLSFKFRYSTKDIVKNYGFEEGIRLSDEILGKDFLSAVLFTTEKDYSVDYSKKRIPQLHIRKPVFTAAPAEVHNEAKNRFVNEDSEYLRLLGISDAEGKIKSGKYSKFRQVDKFIEILDSLYKVSELQKKEEIRIADLGSGKSYLTFAIYDYFSKAAGKKVSITGIEKKADLVNLSNKAAGICGYEGLKFITGDITGYADAQCDIAVALHACDTATDDALIKALEAETGIIILAPCCQKYLRKRIVIPENMKGIFKYGIHEERLSSMLTDGLRAMTLEYFGYETKVFEFISTEHTAKNTMITAVKSGDRNPVKLAEINGIKKEFGIEDYFLDRKLGLNTEL